MEKFKFILLSFLSFVLALLPELIPEEWKALLKNKLGSNYASIWLTLFSISTVVFLYLTWQEKYSNNSSPMNTLKVTGSHNISRQNAKNIGKQNSMDIEGDYNNSEQI